MIHSTTTTMTPMTIQVTAVEDMENGSSEGDGLWPRSIYGAAGAKGSGVPRHRGTRRRTQRSAHSRRAPLPLIPALSGNPVAARRLDSWVPAFAGTIGCWTASRKLGCALIVAFERKAHAAATMRRR